MKHAICLISSLMVFFAAMIIACALIVAAILSNKTFLHCIMKEKEDLISHPNESTETESTPLSDIVPDHQWIW